MLNGWDGVLGTQVCFFPSKHGESSWCKKKNPSILVSYDYSTFPQHSCESPRCLFANFSRVCTCAFLSRGTLWALHFTPLRCSVTNCYLGDCRPSCLEIINKLLPRRSGLPPHLSRHQVYSSLWDLAWSSRPMEIDSQLVFLIFSYHRNNTWLLPPLVACQSSCDPFQSCAGIQFCTGYP